MKKYRRILLIFGFVVLCNVPPLHGIFTFFVDLTWVEGTTEYEYFTKDMRYIYLGSLKDTLNNPCYKEYIKLFPYNSHILYRIQPMYIWKFWHWGEYLFKEKWHQPYLYITWYDLKEADDFFGKTYHSSDGSVVCGPSTIKDN